ncbi:hypothetical protein, partial [Escherichia coli]|uniref:hypothetical protein n=1 Tax=Escherichia coli TaxID=562 RepID=UPI002B23FC61
NKQTLRKTSDKTHFVKGDFKIYLIPCSRFFPVKENYFLGSSSILHPKKIMIIRGYYSLI